MPASGGEAPSVLIGADSVAEFRLGPLSVSVNQEPSLTMYHRPQRTIRRVVETSGIGFLTGADVKLRFLPAPPNHGIAFQRTDCDGSVPVPARLEYAVPRQRRTAIEHRGGAVEMIEHVMAALAGLQIDNCLVQLNAPEPPGGDGSSLIFVDALVQADAVEQGEPQGLLVVDDVVRAGSEDDVSEIVARPPAGPVLAINYLLDYGPHSPIPPQTQFIEITPASFIEHLAFARTFVLESEVEALRAQGYGRRTTAKDLLVFGSHGVVENQLRAADECARHKILDCLGDFALIGCDIYGHFSAYRSGHRLNREVVRLLQAAAGQACASSEPHAA